MKVELTHQGDLMNLVLIFNEGVDLRCCLSRLSSLK
jgi:hypothetical protein